MIIDKALKCQTKVSSVVKGKGNSRVCVLITEITVCTVLLEGGKISFLVLFSASETGLQTRMGIMDQLTWIFLNDSIIHSGYCLKTGGFSPQGVPL